MGLVRGSDLSDGCIAWVVHAYRMADGAAMIAPTPAAPRFISVASMGKTGMMTPKPVVMMN